MIDIDRLNKINEVIYNFFKVNPSLEMVRSKDLMSQFIKAGIFKNDQNKGLPIRKILRELDRNKQLNLIPNLYKEKKKVNTNWFFIKLKSR
jgi:hypothetical protein